MGSTRLVVLEGADDWGHAPEPLPIAEDRAHAGSGLLAEADAAECGDNPGVADLFLPWIEGLPGAVAQHPLDLHRRASLVAGASAHE